MRGWQVVFPRPHEVRLEPFDLPMPGAGETIVRALCSLISTGTEMTALNQSFGEGTHWAHYVRYPHRPGYSLIGVVERIGAGVETLVEGQRVAVSATHASHHLVQASACSAVPDGLSNEEAIWFSLAHIGFRGAQAAKHHLGQRVAFVGVGPVGQMAVRWAGAAGASPITAIDLAPLRLEAARRGGATVTVEERVDQVTLNPAPDVVIDCTGNAAVFREALRLVKPYGRVVVLGDVGQPSDQHLTSDVMVKGLSIVGAHASHVRYGVERLAVYRLFFEVVQYGRFAVDRLVTHRFDPSHAEEAYGMAQQRRAETLGLVFIWEGFT